MKPARTKPGQKKTSRKKPARHACTQPRRSGCPISFGLDLFGDRWTLLVIRDLLLRGKRYYSDFLNSDERISTNILADRLKRLEDAAVIERLADPEHGKRIEYRLTQKGRDLLPVLMEIVRWSGRHDPATEAPREFLQALEADREGLMQEILANIGQDFTAPRKKK